MLDLLAILSVEKSKRIRCQAEGCGRGVYSAIHVLRIDGQIKLYGSECYKKLCGDNESKPSYGSWGDSVLTDEQRQALLDNTEQLLQQLKAQYEEELKRKDAPMLEIVEPSEPVQTPDQGSGNIEYEAIRDLICMECWTSFRSKVRRCPSCNNIDSVVTKA